ncbi:hypothetical protein RRG08_052403 [Elysia crispata]|uniref:Uncharacterized protein n=1 Tax=Elysia crispata TaxID=231223 RepID=A0AAE1E9F5_9GAST|nr:hypothetical protein RRG08_052403 [Elysia crispata]
MDVLAFYFINITYASGLSTRPYLGTESRLNQPPLLTRHSMQCMEQPFSFHFTPLVNCCDLSPGPLRFTCWAARARCQNPRSSADRGGITGTETQHLDYRGFPMNGPLLAASSRPVIGGAGGELSLTRASRLLRLRQPLFTRLMHLDTLENALWYNYLRQELHAFYVYVNRSLLICIWTYWRMHCGIIIFDKSFAPSTSTSTALYLYAFGHIGECIVV